MKLILETPKEDKALRQPTVTPEELMRVMKDNELGDCIEVMVLDDMEKEPDA